MLKIGVIRTSSKENERRVPIHPDHLVRIPGKVREHLFFERAYGLPFGVSDESIAPQVAGMPSREEILSGCDVIVIPKPVQEDLAEMRPGAALWGWAHCVQDTGFTQVAIDRRVTVIAWEGMNQWGPDGQWQRHVFHKNNEIAGYAGVLHALGLTGLNGHYGPPRRAIVIGFGSVGRGAACSLRNQGFDDVTVFTLNAPNCVPKQISGAAYHQMRADSSGRLLAVDPNGSTRPFVDALASADIIVSAILQDTDRPLMFLQDHEINRLKPGCLIIDISCDAGMGFPFARPTTFEAPTFKAGPATYYGVDHTPSYLWRSASWEISEALIPFLPVVAGGPEQWDRNETIRRAIGIRDGVVQNPKILSFQNRLKEYPHSILGGAPGR